MPGQPSGLLLFGILFLGVLCVIGSMWLVSRISRWARGEAPLLPAWVSRVWEEDRVRSVELRSQTDRRTTQTDQQTARPSVVPKDVHKLALDRTRAAVLEELLTHGWTVTDLRREGILRGDNDTISKEVAETRKRLGLSDPDRTIKVRDEKGERVIPA
jgi:hypothetical protein